MPSKVTTFTDEQWALLAQLPPYTMAIDPGDTTGFACTFDDETASEEADLGQHYGVGALPAWQFIDHLRAFLRESPIERLLVEEYRIYPKDANTHRGRTVPTAEYIGAIKCVARFAGVPVIEQGAAVKKPTAGRLKEYKFKLLGNTQHELDAQYHLWHFALKRS